MLTLSHAPKAVSTTRAPLLAAALMGTRWQRAEPLVMVSWEIMRSFQFEFINLN